MDAAENLTPIERRLLAKFPLPSTYFRWVNDLAPCRVVILARESTRQQDRDGNLRWQRTLYRRECRALGFDVLRTFGEIGSGHNYFRRTLEEAVAYARRFDAIVVAEATNRFVRPRLYSPSTFPDAPYALDELDRIAEIAGGVTLATFLHPDMPEWQVRSHQIKRGLQKPPQPGIKNDCRERYRPQALILKELGASTREIAKALGQRPSTVGDWLKM